MPSLLSIASVALLCLSTANASPHKPIQTPSLDPFFYKGFDLSSLHILELGNVTYKDTVRHNATRPAEDILGDGGMNTVRLRYVCSNLLSYDGREIDVGCHVESGSILSLDNTI
jgi:arabinogalactan endo-1,4-beta-galactosidase